ncbi:MAG TPA: ABC transporter permease [Kiritimatiellia bacterium]|nr:ABC transporter permease [Kiritimatiellia bacterium]
MVGYILRRLLLALPVLAGISLLSFSLVRLVPGDTVTAMLGMNYTEEQAATLRRELGLDRSLAVQYGRWAARAIRGDLGASHFTGLPVTGAILERLPVTLQLAGGAVLLALLIALPLGVAGAARRGGAVDAAASGVGILGLSVPNFWLGTLLILFFSMTLGWLPSGGFVPFGIDPVENLRSMILPTCALAAAVCAVLVRMIRSSVIEVLDQDYILMAEAKGCSPARVVWRHALRNAMIPVITVLGIQVGYLLGGSVVIEAVFSLPGIGQLALQAISNRDYVLLQGVILFVGSAFLAINLVVDVLYAALNPAIRVGGPS